MWHYTGLYDVMCDTIQWCVISLQFSWNSNVWCMMWCVTIHSVMWCAVWHYTHMYNLICDNIQWCVMCCDVWPHIGCFYDWIWGYRICDGIHDLFCETIWGCMIWCVKLSHTVCKLMCDTIQGHVMLYLTLYRDMWCDLSQYAGKCDVMCNTVRWYAMWYVTQYSGMWCDVWHCTVLCDCDNILICLTIQICVMWCVTIYR